MGNRISTTQEPVIMTKAFLEDKTVKNLVFSLDLDMYEFRRLVKLDGLVYSSVYSLDLENQSLVNINDLWVFKHLTTLNMPNNLLEKIEGLECLINLQSLDLSFNFIACIKNLEKVVNLIHLNLTSNEIVVLENMDSLLKLESFLVRHNKIKSFDSVNYLVPLKKLSCLAIDENPFMQEASRLRIISVLPQLKYLDFDVVKAEEIEEAMTKYPLKADENVINKESVKGKFKCHFVHSDKDAFVDGLANNQGFESFLLSDKNYQLLHSFPLASEIATNHNLEVNKIFDKWHETGHKYYQQIQEEKLQFLSMVSKAKEYSLDVSQKEEMQFIDFKEKIPGKLCSVYQSVVSNEEKDKSVAEFKEACDRQLQNAFRNFMNSNCLCVDLVLNMCKLYKKEISPLHAKYLSEVEIFSRDLMWINRTFADELQEFYFSTHDFESDALKEFKTEDGELFSYDPSFLQLLRNKNLIKLTLDMSTRIHSTILKERIHNLKLSLHEDLSRTIEEVSNNVFVQQNNKLRNTVIFCNKQKYFLDKLFSKSNIFKHYLGYR